MGDLADEWGEGITNTSIVWSEGMAEWLPIAAIPELADALQAAADLIQPDNIDEMYKEAAGVKDEKSDGKGKSEDDKQKEKEGEEPKKRKYEKKKLVHTHDGVAYRWSSAYCDVSVLSHSCSVALGLLCPRVEILTLTALSRTCLDSPIHQHLTPTDPPILSSRLKRRGLRMRTILMST